MGVARRENDRVGTIKRKEVGGLRKKPGDPLVINEEVTKVNLTGGGRLL